jgi:branched-chain amino acid transport system substrate-binding protein
VSYGDEDPLRLATALATSGDLAFVGVDELRGVQIALDFRGPVLGHAVELSSEDSMCSHDGGTSAATAIAADPTITAVIGTTCSISAVPAAPIISDAGLSMVSPSNTAPSLTAPNTHTAGYLRVAENDADQGVTMAEFVRAEGAATSTVIVPASGLVKDELGEAFVETFEALGGTNLAFEVAEPDGSDVAAVIAAVIAAGVPDVLYFPVLEPLGSAIVTEARAIPGLDGTQLASWEGLAFPGFLDSAGAGAEGMLLTVSDSSFTDTPEYAAFAEAYLDEFGEDPLPLFSAVAFDAANLILDGIERVGIIDGAGTLHIGREALRGALFDTTGLEGLTGTITCDLLGDCGAYGHMVVTVENEELVPMS